MRSTRFLVVLILWCASQAALSAEYIHENDIYEKDDFLKPKPAPFKYTHRDFGATSNEVPVAKLKKIINKELPLDYSNEEHFTERIPSTTPTDDENNSQDIFFFPKKEGSAISKTEASDDVNSDTSTGYDVETRGTTVDPVTIRDEVKTEIKDKKTTINSASMYETTKFPDILYDLATQHENDLETNVLKEKKTTLEMRQQKYRRVLDSYQRMDENMNHFNENIDDSHRMKQEDIDDLNRLLSLKPSVLPPVPIHPPEAILDMRRMKLLDYIARAAHTTGRRPTQAPTIILYGYPPKKSSAMSIFMPEPPECPKPNLLDANIDFKALSEGTLPREKREILAFHLQHVKTKETSSFHIRGWQSEASLDTPRIIFKQAGRKQEECIPLEEDSR